MSVYGLKVIRLVIATFKCIVVETYTSQFRSVSRSGDLVMSLFFFPSSRFLCGDTLVYGIRQTVCGMWGASALTVFKVFVVRFGLMLTACRKL